MAARRAWWPGGGRVGGVRLRSRVLVSILTVTGGAVLVFTLPLAWAMAKVYRRGAVLRLQRDAIWSAAKIQWSSAGGHGVSATSGELPHGVDMGLYTPTGHRIAGQGPMTSLMAASSRDAGVHQGIELGHLAVVAPVTREAGVVGVVRVWMPWDSVTDQWLRAWLLLAAVGLVVVLLAAVVAWQLARRIAVPLERLTDLARALGEGDFSIQVPRTAIREADVAGQALAATARRIGRVLERERRFATAASHQLRTPLTALALGLEAELARPGEPRHDAVATALRRVEHLGDSLHELLSLARETHRSDIAVDLAAVARQVADRHRAAVIEAGRRLVVRCEVDLAPVRASPAAIAQIIGTLLDNALVHGRGEIRLDVVDLGAGLAVQVGDDGPGPAAGDVGNEPVFASRLPGPRHGIGLPLARELAQAEGGRLVLRRAGARAVFALMLPVYEPGGGLCQPAESFAGDAGRSSHR